MKSLYHKTLYCLLSQAYLLCLFLLQVLLHLALVLCSLDLGGRPYFNFDFKFPTERVGDMDTQLFREFFQAVANGAGMNLHFMILSGENSHHIAEAMYKAFAKALDEATTIDPRIEGVQSTKGML